jgi:hypothetical protein
MSSLADFPELVGFFSYSREDDDDSKGALSELRDRIQRELRGQLGRSAKTFRLWQDKESIAPGKLWESEIKGAIGQSAFFIPIITPTVVASEYCHIEFDAFLEREKALGRNDLIFPILYIRVPGLEDGVQRKQDLRLSVISRRQYVDWRELRYRDANSEEVRKAVARFCSKIVDTLTWSHPPASPGLADRTESNGPAPAAPPPSAVPRQPESVDPIPHPVPDPVPRRYDNPPAPGPSAAPGVSAKFLLGWLFGAFAAASRDASLWPFLGLVAALFLIDGSDTLFNSVVHTARNGVDVTESAYFVLGVAEMLAALGTLRREKWIWLVGPAVCFAGMFAQIYQLAIEEQVSRFSVGEVLLVLNFAAAIGIYLAVRGQDLNGRMLSKYWPAPGMKARIEWAAFALFVGGSIVANVLTSDANLSWWIVVPWLAAVVAVVNYTYTNFRRFGGGT